MKTTIPVEERQKIIDDFKKAFVGAIKADSDKWLNTDSHFFQIGGDYQYEALKVLTMVGKEQMDRVFSDPYCDLDISFVGFLDVYKNIPEQIPKGITVIDFGCCEAVQSAYFKDFNYIGIDCACDPQYRVSGDNITHYYGLIQRFIKENPYNLDFNKCVAICSYVPDKEAEQMVMDNFKYAKVQYCDEIKKDTIKEYPKNKSKEIER